MFCDNCGKREVEVLIKQVVNQEVRHLNLCRICAEEMGFISPMIPSITISFSINDDIPRQKKVRRVQPKKKEPIYESLMCPTCMTKFSTFREEGLLGCPKCYEVFRFPLGAYLQKTQGAESHWDGTSNMFKEIGLFTEEMIQETEELRRNELEENIAKLRYEMNEAISREDYERAAELRDMLAPLVGNVGRKNDG
jgi:protein arginine kinase activator